MFRPSQVGKSDKFPELSERSPMKWIRRQAVPDLVGGKETRVKTKKGEHDLTNLERGALAQTVTDSRRIVSDVITMLTWNIKTGTGPGQPNIDALAGLYFTTGAALTVGQRTLIISKLELVHNGLN